MKLLPGKCVRASLKVGQHISFGKYVTSVSMMLNIYPLTRFELTNLVNNQKLHYICTSTWIISQFAG